MTSHVLLVWLLSTLLLFTSLTSAQPPESVKDVRILSVSGCVDVYPVTVNCSLSATLRIQTAGLPNVSNWATRPLYISASPDSSRYFVTGDTWLDTTDATLSTVFVNVTAYSYYPHLTGALIPLSFIDYGGAFEAGSYPSSAKFAGFSFVFDGPPTLTSISGCDGSGQSTLNCIPDEAAVTIVGSGLNWYRFPYAAYINIGDSSSPTVGTLRVSNDTHATLELDWLYSRVLKPHHYTAGMLSFSFSSFQYGRLGERTGNSWTTNALQISFAPLPPPRINTWSARITPVLQSNARKYTNRWVQVGVMGDVWIV